MKKSLARLAVKGGVISPGELKECIDLAESVGMNAISFGSRQDIILPSKLPDKIPNRSNEPEIILPELKGNENIVSSYVSADIFPATSWLTSSRYLYILEQFNFHSSLKINITDPLQRLVPLFTGHLNFIASSHDDYWYLYIRLTEWEKMEMYPALINSWDMGKIAFNIEKLLKEEPDSIEMIFELLNDLVITENRNFDKPLDIPYHPFPYYEGMNKLNLDKYWLGLYWRNNLYDLTFMKNMCERCMENQIGKICITPWKSFIIKGIPKYEKLEWEKFLGSFGINVRHSLLELNWHLPVGDTEALDLKKFLVRTFDQNDISTYGLTFGVTDYLREDFYFTSIVIEKNQSPKTVSSFQIRNTYNVLYAENFDPNNREYIVYVQDIDKIELPIVLMELSKMYFKQLGSTKKKNESKKEEIKEIEIFVHQCPDCMTIYDPEYGDETQDIPPNVPFSELPEDYSCNLCNTAKRSFIEKPIVKSMD
ncbi:rubredoxin [Membranihabitans maritimus]|uniref:rubredoxin n=1 Tax=Membranihabitans maritimus TaxID=2904244 RepID=UPI001F38C4FF|nr:rubredoxin [Membranihabitans maritimus]